MVKYTQQELDQDWKDFSNLVDTTVKDLINKKGNVNGEDYFNSTFTDYTQIIQPAANRIANKYSTLVSEKVHAELKVLLQARFELGLKFFHQGVTKLVE